MMFGKLILLISYTLLSCKSLPQVQRQSPNTIGDEILSTQEAELLNFLFDSSRGNFDFQGKKVAFVTGSSGNHFLSKSDYFTQIKNWIDESNTPSTFFVLLTQEEKEKSGGYDVIVTFFVKVISNRQKSKIIKQLASNCSSQIIQDFEKSE